MFKALPCSSSGGLRCNCIYAASGIVTLCSFQNKFIILPCGRLVDKNTFSKMCVFKSLTAYTDYDSYEKQNAHFLIIMKSKAMKSLCCC